MPGTVGTFDARTGAAVAAVVLQPFALLLAASLALRGVTPAQVAVADPLVQLLGAHGLPWISALSLALGFAAWRVVRPDRAALQDGVRRAALAVLAVASVLVLLRVGVGPSLPGFIPPEESARPGLACGLAAGVLEEALFRLVLLSALLAVGLGRSALGFVAVSLGIGFAFALSHEIGPAAFRADYFLTRLALPGALMSLGCRWLGFPFVVAGHCAAHVLIPFLFA